MEKPITKSCRQSQRSKFCDFGFNDFRPELREYGFGKHPKLRKDGSPIIIAKDENNNKYLLDERVTVESLEKFVTGF